MQAQTTSEIPLRARGGAIRAYALVDTSDFARLNQWRWSLDDRGYVQSLRCIDGRHRKVYMHREVLGLEPGDPRQGDHIEVAAKHDNRRQNLRIVTGAQNAQNVRKRAGTASRYRGVWFSRHEKKWKAEAWLNGKKTCLGTYADELDAARAAQAWRLEHMPYAVEQPLPDPCP